MKKRTSIFTLFLFIMLASVFSATLVMGSFWVKTEYEGYRDELETLRSQAVRGKRSLIKEKVEEVLRYIEYQKGTTEARLKSTIKSRVEEAHVMAERIVSLNRGRLTRRGMERHVIESLRTVRFNRGRGYYFATEMTGVERLFADKPEMENRNLINMRTADGRYMIREMLALAKNKGEGFIRYLWTKPGEKGNMFPKISYIKYFKPFDWVIGTGEYLDTVEEDIQEEVLDWIKNIRFGKNGYVFVLNLEGKTLSSGFREGVIEDTATRVWGPERQKMIDDFVRASAKPGGTFVKYKWEKPDKRGMVFNKETFLKRFKDWQWIIGAGVYMDEIENLVLEKRSELRATIRSRLYSILFIAAVLYAVSFAIFWIARKRLGKSFGEFISFFKKAAMEDVSIDPNRFDLREFFMLAEQADIMIAERRKFRERLRKSGEILEDRVLERTRELAEARNLIREVIDSLPSAVVRVDNRLRVLWMNSSATERFGIDAEQFSGYDIFTILPMLERVKSILKKSVHENERAIEKITIQSAEREDIFQVTVNPLVAEHHTSGAVVIVDEITGIEKREQQLRQMQKMETVNNLAGGLAHDFNNLLGGISGSTELLKLFLGKESLEDREKINSFLKTLSDSTDRAADMVKRLLMLSRKHELSVKRFDLRESISNTIRLAKDSFPKSVQLENRAGDEPLTMEGDPYQIEQLLLNICLNSSHAMTIMRENLDEQGGILRVKTDTVEADDGFCSLFPDAVYGKLYRKVEIGDTGIGMTREVISRMFEPFFTTKKEKSGSGLGLSMVYNIVRQHNGFIDVRSTPGKGTVMTVYFPAAEGDPEAIGKRGELKLKRGRGKVLVVDDEQVIRAVTSEMVRQLGYETEVFPGGKEIISWLEENEDFNGLIILDIAMPGMNGYETFIRIKEMMAQTSVLFASGSEPDEKIRTLIERGDAQFARKPVDIEKLSGMLRKMSSTRNNG